MKFATTAFVSLFVASAQGFSVSMSSIGYLDKLSSGASLSSFASTAPAPSWSSAPAPASMPYSPPSYSTPSYAPAPAPTPTYQSAFADLPANNDLNYLKTLGGGASMKKGKNFSGVSSYFRPTGQGSTYLEALKGKAMEFSYAAPAAPQGWGAPAAAAPSPSYSYAPPPAPAQSYSYGGSAPAPAPASGSYLDNIAKASPVRSDYSGVNPRPAKVRSAFGSYLETL